MARKIEFTVDVDGEEKDAFIKLSSAVEQAAVDKSFDDDISTLDALAEITGMDKEMVQG